MRCMKNVIYTITICMGVLDGGPLYCMSDLRHRFVNCNYVSDQPVNFKMVSYRMSNLRKDLCYVDNIFSHVKRLHVACQF